MVGKSVETGQSKLAIIGLEYRHDYSNQPTIVKGDGFVKSQDTASVGLVYVFSSGD